MANLTPNKLPIIDNHLLIIFLDFFSFFCFLLEVVIDNNENVTKAKKKTASFL